MYGVKKFSIKLCDRLVVLDESHVNGAFTECLTLHVDSVLSDKSITSFTSGDSARTGSLSVSLRMGGVQLIRFS